MKRLSCIGTALALAAALFMSGCDLLGPVDPVVENSGTFALSETNLKEVTVTITATATSYKIERGTAAAGPFTTVNEALTTTSYVDTTITSAGTYFYKITATKDSATFELTSTASSVIVHDLQAPTEIKVTPAALALTTDTITISWTGAPLAEKYDVYESIYPPQNDPNFFTTETNFLKIATDLTASTFSINPMSPPSGYNATAGATYYFYLVSKRGTISSSKSLAKVSITYAGPAGAAADLKATLNSAGGSSVVQLTWTQDLNAEGYTIFRALDKAGPWDIGNVLASAAKQDVLINGNDTCTYNDSTAQANTTYWYIVHGTNAANGPANNAAIVTSSTFAAAVPVSSYTNLSAPTNVTAAFNDGAAVSLSWSAVDTASGYQIYRSTNSLDWMKIGAVQNGLVAIGQTSGSASVTYSDNNNLKSVTYYYWILATGANNAVSLPSVTASVAVNLVPPAPNSLVATPASDTVVNVSWNAPNYAGTLTYTVQRLSGATWTDDQNLTQIPATSGKIAALTANTQYTFRVIAFNENGSASAASASQTVTTLPKSPTLSAGTITSSSVVLNWTLSPGASNGYRLYKLNSATGAYVSTGTALANNATTTTVTGLLGGTAYKFKLTALNSALVEPDVSDDTLVPPFSVTTIALAAPTLNTPTYASGQVTVTWNAVVSATSYVLQYKINTGGAWTDVDMSAWTASGGATETKSFAPTGAISGNYVYVQIKASSAAGDSGFSPSKYVQL